MNMQGYWLQQHKKPLCYQRKPLESVCVSGEGLSGVERRRGMFQAAQAQSCDLRASCDEIELWTNQRRLSTSQVGLLVVNRLDSEPQKAARSVQAHRTRCHRLSKNPLPWPGEAHASSIRQAKGTVTGELLSDLNFLFAFKMKTALQGAFGKLQGWMVMLKSFALPWWNPIQACLAALTV